MSLNSDHLAERNSLAEAITLAAVKAGIIDGSQSLTGPQLVMLCDDLAAAVLDREVPAPQPNEAEYLRGRREAVDENWQHWEAVGQRVKDAMLAKVRDYRNDFAFSNVIRMRYERLLAVLEQMSIDQESSLPDPPKATQAEKDDEGEGT